MYVGTERDTLTAEIKNGPDFSQSQSDPCPLQMNRSRVGIPASSVR